MAKDKKQTNTNRDTCAVRRKTSIGGQALMEGIMMRGPKKSAMAVRNPEGEIVFEEWENKVNKRPKIAKLPIVRGVFGFIDSMITGYKCLMRSAALSGLDEAEAELAKENEEKKIRKKAEKIAKKTGRPLDEVLTEETEKAEAEAAEKARVASEKANEGKEKRIRRNAEKNAKKTGRPLDEVLKEETEKAETDGAANTNGSSPLLLGIMVVGVVLAVLLMLVLFIWLPTFIFDLLTRLVPALYQPEAHPALASLCKSAFEGIFKIIIIVSYMALVALMKDIRRTFEYHGAEHKTIFCYEHGMALTVENVRKQRRFHPRCGTSFLILMMLVSIFVCFFIDPISIAVSGATLSKLPRTIVRFLLLPLVMGIGYEVLKFTGRHENRFTRILSAPGVWLQHITVREPDDAMIECAIKAFIAVIPENEMEEELAKIAAETPAAPDTEEAEQGEKNKKIFADLTEEAQGENSVEI